jgi:diguanylate cyclase (GGDEF)-like protein/PAS domain S-box-containing protein
VAEGVSQTEQELRERLDVERTLSLITRAFIDRGVDATDACINDSLALVGELTRTERAYVFVSPDGGLTFDMKYEWHREGTTSQLAAQQGVPASSFPSWWSRVSKRERIVIPSVTDLPEGSPERTLLEPGGVKALATVPMLLRDEAIGSVGVTAYHEVHEWSPATISLLEQFAAFVTSALERKAAEDERRASEAALRASEERFRMLVQNSPDTVIVIDALGTFMYASPQIENLIGHKPEDLIGTNALDIIHPDEHDEVAIAIANTVDNDGTQGNEGVGLRCRHVDGSYVPIEVTGSSLVDDPLVGGIIVNVRDMRESIRIAATLEEVEIRFRQVFDHCPIGLVVATPDGRCVNVNPAMRAMLGYTLEEMLAFNFTDITHPDDLDSSVGKFSALTRGDSGDYRVEKRYRKHDGSYLWARVTVRSVNDAEGRVLYIIAHVEDITERKQFEERLAYEATHDALTGLPLRTLLLDHLELALAGARRHGTNVAVLFIDLDRFKKVNDSMGHAAGDELLAEVAGRLRTAVRDIDTPGRFGGDEFVVVCPDLNDVRDVVAIAERIRELLETPAVIRGVPVFVGASIGIAVADTSIDADVDAATLLGQADTAAYRAKDRGRNRYEIFDEELRATVAKRLDTEMGLRHALEHRELCLVYQPIVEIERNEVVGFEALVRWRRDGELVGPAEFLDVAEETGLIVPLGQQVLEMACRQLAEWERALPVGRVPRLSVNLSARQLTQPELAQDVRNILDATGVKPEHLCLEITETVLMQDTPQVIATINELRDLGVRLAIDDFGTGYSSLSYLRRLPVSAVKIDRSFILELGADHEGSTIVASVISLAHALGMEIIAEGVETIEHVASLLTLGCDHAQGYYFSRPVAPEVAFDYLRRGNVGGEHAA